MERMSVRDLGDVPSSTAAGLKGWNWGAFGLTWIWGLAHRTPIALLVFVPVLGWFGMPVVLGFKGNEWAWKNSSSPDLETFRRRERVWARAAALTWVGVLVGTVIAWKVAVTALTNSDAFALARTELQADPNVSAMLGAPIELGTPSGSLALGGAGGGTSDLKFSVSGPNMRGEAFISARQTLGSWRVEAAAIQLANGARMVRLSGAPDYKWASQ